MDLPLIQKTRPWHNGISRGGAVMAPSVEGPGALALAALSAPGCGAPELCSRGWHQRANVLYL